MKIAVYAIAKNEEHNVEEWFESAKDADELVLVDTGSDDDTYDMSRRLGVKTFREEISPWRFDDARNKALLHVSPDVDFCIALDLDERLQPGWKEAFKEVKPDTTRIKYHMTTIVDNKEFMWYWANRCHKREGYHWEYAVHEKPVYHDGEEVFQLLDFETIHEQDDRERPYLEMLKDCVTRYPLIRRYSMLYARELLFHNKFIMANNEFARCIQLPGDRTFVEQADLYRYMGHCGITPLECFLESLKYGERRETYIDIAKYYSDRDMYKECLEYADKAFAITKKPIEFISFAYAWGPLAYNMAALAAMNLRDYVRAEHYIDMGLIGGSSEKLLQTLKLIQINEKLSMV